MRDAVDTVGLLQKQLNELQIENQLLKSILDRSGMETYKNLCESVEIWGFEHNRL